MKRIEKILKNNGIELFGVCDFDRENLIECRNKKFLPENAQSIIMTALPYRLPDEMYKDRNISRYATVRDYHDVFKIYLDKITTDLKKLFPENDFISFTDNSPIYEVESAVKSGIGVRGENGLLITEKYGSWVFLGEIVTDLKIKGTDYQGECLHCGKCKEICPALKEDKKEKCLSSITQKKGDLTDEEKKKITENKSAWGCDLCQEICPMNKNKKYTEIAEFLNSAKPKFSSGDSLEGRAYAWRGQAVIERNLGILEERKV